MDATLRELSDLVKDVQAAARARNARISFAFVYPDVKGRNVMRQVGTVHATRPSDDDNKSLRQLHFQIGKPVHPAQHSVHGLLIPFRLNDCLSYVMQETRSGV